MTTDGKWASAKDRSGGRIRNRRQLTATFKNREEGGDNPMIVLDDVDYAARTATFGPFLHRGQICLGLNIR